MLTVTLTLTVNLKANPKVLKKEIAKVRVELKSNAWAMAYQM